MIPPFSLCRNVRTTLGRTALVFVSFPSPPLTGSVLSAGLAYRAPAMRLKKGVDAGLGGCSFVSPSPVLPCFGVSWWYSCNNR